ncbi:MAG: ABC transporter permease, partial [Thermoanaerobaculales bacterium]
MIKSLYRQRALLAVLVARELRARYRGTFLGYLWSLLNPLLLLGVYTVVFTFVIPARAPTHVPYPLFLFAGLLPWLFASGALLDAAVVLADNGPLLK